MPESREPGFVNVTVYWKDGMKAPTTRKHVVIDEDLTMLTIHESDSEYSRVPLASILFYDVEEIS